MIRAGIFTIALLICSVLGAPASAFGIENLISKSQLFVRSKSAAAAECLAPPEIATDFQYIDPVRTKTKPDDLETRISRLGQLQGLTLVDYGFAFEMSFRTLRTPQGYCIHVNKIVIEAGSKVPEIWINPAIRDNTCEFNVTMNHELQHVEVFRNHLHRFETALLRELPIMLRSNAYYTLSTMVEAAAAEERLLSDMNAAIDELYQMSYKRARAEDYALDTPSEYRRLSGLCR